MTKDELIAAVRRIAHSSTSPDEVRQRIIDELGYPYSRDGIAVNMSGGMCQVMFWWSGGSISA
jgi:hypothetical protein